jgi:hypothetical protein
MNGEAVKNPTQLLPHGHDSLSTPQSGGGDMMPKGKGHRFTEKEHRQAQHIMQSEKKEGKSPGRSKEIAWATVNKQKSRKR